MLAEPVLQCDYVVVGSGPGGGPVAANLADAGFRVVLIEAGTDHKSYNYAVPGFHGQSTEDPEMRWDYFVRHYADDAQQRRDSKFTATYAGEQVDGILYPRAGSLGGCSAHNAMITVYPHDSDWERIAAIARADDPADRSWDPANMRRYFERIERCGYIGKADEDLKRGRHGDSGYLGTSVADPSLILGDVELLKILIGAANQTLLDLTPRTIEQGLDKLERVLELAPTLKELLDPRTAADLKAKIPLLWKLLDLNRAPANSQREGIYLIPLAVGDGRRNGARERILQVSRRAPDRLRILTDTLATRILLEGRRAVGVEYVQGHRLYQAAPAPDGGRRGQPGPRMQVRAAREVIIAAGTFNTPQLLMLSGIGPKGDLERLGIASTLDRPAVGRYLQDRYEVGVISQAPQDFPTLNGLTFAPTRPGQADDRAFKQWKETHDGLYTTNGAVVAIVRKSDPSLTDPDLFIFGLPASFKGYYPEYADTLTSRHDEFTWAILKAHTNNTGGTVTLRSTDPLARPEINFRYFREGTDAGGADLRAVAQGVKFVRSFAGSFGMFCELMVRDSVQPKPDIRSDEDIEAWVQAEAWGHHASGTCRIGPKGDVTESVLDTDFRVKGVDGLRVVDASVFPRIPGFFIASAIYMVAEKASESILRAAGRDLPPVDWQPPPDDTWKP